MFGSDRDFADAMPHIRRPKGSRANPRTLERASQNPDTGALFDYTLSRAEYEERLAIESARPDRYHDGIDPLTARAERASRDTEIERLSDHYTRKPPHA